METKSWFHKRKTLHVIAQMVDVVFLVAESWHAVIPAKGVAM
jgi:hypothetical protein